MLNIAKEKFPNVTFLQGDMRQFTLDHKKDSCIVTGRTISYLLSNEDVLKTFHSINRNLEMGGIIVFDFIDALQLIPRIKEGEEVIHTAAYQHNNYQRKSTWTLNLKEGFTFNWLSYYFQITEDGQFVELGKDDSVIRTFTKEELFIFLTLTGFVVLQCVQRSSYAFDTFVITAKKVE